MGAEAGERLLEVDVPGVLQHHRHEARVEQVQHGVLVAADVARDWQPAPRERGVERHVLALGAGIAQEVPCAIEEGVTHIGLAARRGAALWTRRVIPLLVARERAHARVVRPEVVDLGQEHRQLRLGHGHGAARIAVDDRDRRAPVALTRDAPVVQPVVHHRRRRLHRGELGDDGRLGRIHRESGEARRVDDTAAVGAREGTLAKRGIVALARAGDDARDREVVQPRELEVALIVPRHSHDRPRAVLHQHVVGNPDRHRLAARRIARVRAGEDATLLLGRLAAHQVLFPRARHVLAHGLALLVARDRRDEWVLRGEHEVRGAVDRVRARREHGDLDCARRQLVRSTGRHRRAAGERRHVLHGEHEVRPLGLADPVALGALGALRPIEPVEVGEQPAGVVGDPEEPLLQDALLHHRAAPLARAGDHLLVGKHGLVEWAPVDGRLLLVREPPFEELQEDPLRPLVVAGVRRRELVPPVHHQAGALELPAEVGDVARNQLGRVDADLDREVLGVDAEGVVADRLEDCVPLQPLESSMDVVAREREEVAHVEPLRTRVREHHQCVVRPLARGQVGLVGARALPVRLPLLLDGSGVVRDGRLGGGIRCCGVGHRSAAGRWTSGRTKLAPAGSRGVVVHNLSPCGKHSNLRLARCTLFGSLRLR